MSRESGFSLIELLIVVAIILIISAIAIPNMMRARMAANEASAVSSIRTITTAETTYASTFPTIGYTCTLSDLGPPPPGNPAISTAAGVIDSALAGGQKSGYIFALQNCLGNPRSSYTSSAVPATPGGTGSRAFCSATPGVIMQDAGGSVANCLTAGVVIQ